MKTQVAGTLPSRVITARENRMFDRIYNTVGFLGIYFVVTGFVAPVFSGSPLAFAAVLVLMLLGWWLQAGFCAVTRKKREESSRSYEQENKFYQPRLALPVGIVAAILAAVASKLIDSYLWKRSFEAGAYYDEDSVIPLAGAIAVFVVIMLGSFVWFFPFDRLLTGRGVAVGTVLLMIAFMVYSVGGRSMTGSVGVCLICYALCCVVATNQYAISRSYRGTVVSFLTPRARRYNMLLVVALIGGFVLIGGVFYVFFTGIKTLALIVIAAALSNADDSEMGAISKHDPEYQENLNEYIFGSAKPTESLNYWLFIIFFILLGVGLITIIARNTDTVKRIISLIKDWAIALFEMIFRPMIDFAAVDTEDEIFCNYVDEEEKLQDAEIREYRKAAVPNRVTYRDFAGELRARKTPEERYRFAYSFFVSRLGGMQMFVRRSDTPRQIADRVRVSRRFEEDRELDAHLTQITEAYERIGYRGDEASKETEDALETLCGMIKNSI